MLNDRGFLIHIDTSLLNMYVRPPTTTLSVFGAGFDVASPQNWYCSRFRVIIPDHDGNRQV